jgi:hypothetical protein
MDPSWQHRDIDVVDNECNDHVCCTVRTSSCQGELSNAECSLDSTTRCGPAAGAMAARCNRRPAPWLRDAMTLISGTERDEGHA